VLQRIAPFLASMHEVEGRGRVPTPSTLTNRRALDAHFWCHLVALALLALAAMTGEAWLVRAAAAAGIGGAVAYCAFMATLHARLRGHLPAAQPPPEVGVRGREA
jgi:hypothetical protein